MTLFISTPKRQFEISEAYVMALTFIVVYSVTKITKKVIKKMLKKKSINCPNPRGGALEVQFTDDNELALTILTCISDGEQYVLKDPRLKKIIFNLVKAKIKDESLVITPNMMRFLVLKLLNEDQTYLVQFGNLLVSAESKNRLMVRIGGSAAIGLLGAFFSILPYAILMAIIYFQETAACGSSCNNFFEHIPKGEPVHVYGQTSAGHIAITEKGSSTDVTIYNYEKKNPANTKAVDVGEKNKANPDTVRVTRVYKKSNSKAKEVKFSDFAKTDPVLSKFDPNIQEPEVPQQICVPDQIIRSVRNGEF